MQNVVAVAGSFASLSIMTAPKKILIVEDEPLIAMMLQDYMDILGFEVVGVVECVADALGAVESLSFDMAVLDVNLMNGEKSDAVAVELARRGIPFIMSSGDARAPGPWQGRPMLSKPYMLSDVERIVASLGMPAI